MHPLEFVKNLCFGIVEADNNTKDRPIKPTCTPCVTLVKYVWCRGHPGYNTGISSREGVAALLQ